MRKNKLIPRFYPGGSIDEMNDAFTNEQMLKIKNQFLTQLILNTETSWDYTTGDFTIGDKTYNIWNGDVEAKKAVLKFLGVEADGKWGKKSQKALVDYIKMQRKNVGGNKLKLLASKPENLGGKTDGTVEDALKSASKSADDESKSVIDYNSIVNKPEIVRTVEHILNSKDSRYSAPILPVSSYIVKNSSTPVDYPNGIFDLSVAERDRRSPNGWSE